MSYPVNIHFSKALKQMKVGVTLCCWIIGVSLIVQVISWSLLTYMDLRYEKYEVATASETVQVVTPEEIRKQAIQNAEESNDESVVAADINKQFSRYDRYFNLTTSFTSAIGTMSTLALLPFLALGVILAAASATNGIERTTSSFMWGVLIVLLALPWSTFFPTVPYGGLFPDYATLATDVDFAKYGQVSSDAAETVRSTGLLFYCRYLILPLACIAGIAAVGLRFRSGVEAGLLPKEDFKLDPEQEKEISRIKATSMAGGGGRAAGALKSTVKPGEPTVIGPSIHSVNPGNRPERPI